MNKFKTLHLNESPFNLNDSLKENIVKVINGFDFNTYPDTKNQNLRQVLATQNKVAPENIICSNGSDELISIILDTYYQSGKSVITHSPTFSEYKIMSTRRGYNFIETQALDDLSCNIESLVKLSKENPNSIIFICSPNNPTGEIIEAKKIEKIIKDFEGIVVLDEAYWDFSGITLKNLINIYPNLIILRTLSKAYALASLRVGYAISNINIVEKLMNNKMPYNLNKLSEQIAISLLTNQDIVKSQINFIVKERNRLINSLQTINDLKTFNSNTNFILIRSSKAKQIVKKLDEQNIKTRTFNNAPLDDSYIRFSISDTITNNQVLNTIMEVHNEKS